MPKTTSGGSEEPPYGRDPDVSAVDAIILTLIERQREALQAQIMEIRHELRDVYQANSMQHIVQCGLEDLCAQFEPLRRMFPAPGPLTDVQVQGLRRISADLARPVPPPDGDDIEQRIIFTAAGSLPGAGRKAS